MGLLATLPRATRGHLGAANNSLTRATRGYLQGEEEIPRRPGGGLFAPEIQPSEGRRRIKAVLSIMLDGNSRWRFEDELETRIKSSGWLWLTARSEFTRGSRAPVRLRSISPEPQPAGIRPPTPLNMQTAAATDAADATVIPTPTTARRRSKAGLVLALESRYRLLEAPATTYLERAAGTIWLGGASRFQRFDIDVPSAGNQDDEIALIAALLAQEIGNGR